MTTRAGLLLRLVAATILAGAIAAVLGTVVLRATARDALRDDIGERNAALAVEVAARLDGRIDAGVSALQLVTSRQPVAALDPAADAELRTMIANTGDFDELVLYDPAGDPVATAASRFVASIADEPSRPDLFPAITTRPVVELDPGVPPTLVIVVPVENPPGTTAGALLARLPLEVAMAPALRVDAGLATTRFMVAADGLVIVHPERDRVLREERLPIEEIRAASDLARVDIDGRPHLLSIAPMESLGAAVVIDQVEAIAFAPISDRLRELTVILLLVMSATVLAVIAVGTWLLGPLGPLTQAVRRLGLQERGVRVEEESRGEVHLLATEFNRLAETLDRRQDELDELHRLSVLVNTRTTREEVAAKVVAGSARLLEVDQAAFCSAVHDAPEILAVHGKVSEGRALEQANTAIRIGRVHLDQDSEGFDAAVPVRSGDGGNAGALVLRRSTEPFGADELAVAEAYAGFAGVALDNLARLALEQELGAELAEAVEQRRSLMRTVSHELRTPLTCIDGFSSTLLDQWDAYGDAQRQDLVTKIRHHTNDLEQLVNRLLDFAVTERGTMTADLQPVVLADVIAAVLAGAQPLLEGRPVTVEVPDLIVRADPVLLQRALLNLVSNAVKYSAIGAPVVLRAVDDGRRIRLEVIDEGVGLTADESRRAFQPFWRAGHPSIRARGAGLGLALVSEYAQAMGGATGVVSEPGHGSTFFITLERDR